MAHHECLGESKEEGLSKKQEKEKEAEEDSLASLIMKQLGGLSGRQPFRKWNEAFPI